VIEPELPSEVGRRGQRWSDHRMILEGVAWRYRVGAPWRDLPMEFGPWQTVWKRHHRWSLDGTYTKIFVAVQESFGPLPGVAELVGVLVWWTRPVSAPISCRRLAVEVIGGPRRPSQGDGRTTRFRGLSPTSTPADHGSSP
jgi:transposase